MKDVLDIVSKLALVSLLPAGLVVWSYLTSIGWASLFLGSAMTISGLVFIVLVALLLTFLVTAMFIIPSAVVILTAASYDTNKRLPISVVWMYAIAYLIFITSFFASVYLKTGYTAPIIILTPLLTTVAIALLTRLRERRFVGPVVYVRLKLSKLLGMAGLASLSAYSTISPLATSYAVASNLPNPDLTTEIFITILSVVITSITLVPGILYLVMRTKHTGWVRPLQGGGAGLVLLGYILISTTAFLAPAQAMYLRATGLYATEKRTFQIIEKNLLPVLEASGIPVIKKGESHYVAAHVRYSFGGTKLICKAAYEPGLETTAEVEEAKRLRLKKTSLLGGLNCVPTLAAELREFKLHPAAEKQFFQLEKVEKTAAP